MLQMLPAMPVLCRFPLEAGGFAYPQICQTASGKFDLEARLNKTGAFAEDSGEKIRDRSVASNLRQAAQAVAHHSLLAPLHPAQTLRCAARFPSTSPS